MSDDYVVPRLLRSYPLVLRQPGQGRSPLRVTPGAFTAAGLPVPDDARQHNVYRLTGSRGQEWTPARDRHVARFGAELLPDGALVLVDVDQPAAVDGSPMGDALRWLADRAAEAGEILDLTVPLTVRTPGHPGSGHLPGWHLWYAAPTRPVRMGALARNRSVELRRRGTCPGSSGYEARSVPDEVPVLPGWLCAIAGSPSPAAATAAGPCPPGRAWRRMEGMVARLLETHQPGRNSMLYAAARLAGELGFDQERITNALTSAAERIGLTGEDGQGSVLATIASGYRTGAASRLEVSS